MEQQNRFKSWLLWSSLAALVVYVIKLTTGFDAGPIWDELADLLLPVLVCLGLINNPTSKTTL